MTVKIPPFQVFLEQHRDDVHRFLVAMVGRQDADDCFQETFIAALRAYGGLNDASNLRGWVLTIAHRKALDSHRSRARTPAPLAAVPERPEASESERDPALWEAVRALPPKQRAAVVHRFVNDLPYREIAKVEGGTEEAARRNVHEALTKLREVWRA